MATSCYKNKQTNKQNFQLVFHGPSSNNALWDLGGGGGGVTPKKGLKGGPSQKKGGEGGGSREIF